MEKKYAFTVLVGKKELGRPRRRCENSVTIDLRQTGFGGVDWIHLAQGRDRLRDLVSMVMNLRVPEMGTGSKRNVR